MPEREERRELRGALARGEGAAVVGLLGSGHWPEDCLQLAGVLQRRTVARDRLQDPLRADVGQREAKPNPTNATRAKS